MAEVNYWRNMFYDLLEEVEQMYGKEHIWEQFREYAKELEEDNGRQRVGSMQLVYEGL